MGKTRILTSFLDKRIFYSHWEIQNNNTGFIFPLDNCLKIHENMKNTLENKKDLRTNLVFFRHFSPLRAKGLIFNMVGNDALWH